MDITGALLIGGSARPAAGLSFRAVDPSTGAELDPPFAVAGAADVDEACALAAAAFPAFHESPAGARATLLDAIAAGIEQLGDALILRAMAETGLPRARLEGERGRTTGQLRLFAGLLRGGDWAGLRVDPALPDRKPAPRPDLRQRQVALGPVAVFGASNFPLAFSTAGGDTASALAAGCPVVVKGHPAHPGTTELVGRAIAKAVADQGLPAGVFAQLAGPANALGEALVADPRIKAVGFTGSRAGGLALSAIAARRPEPIPVYAEMSSVNPVVLLPHALAARAAALAEGFVASLTLGVGQFCTNPGLIFALEGPDLDRFLAHAGAVLARNSAAVMLSPAIHRAYEHGRALLDSNAGAERLARGRVGEGVNQACGGLYVTELDAFLADATLSHEVFGPASLVVRCPDLDGLSRAIQGLEGQLTASLHLDEGDFAEARRLLPILEAKAGRVLANGWPTGVEVSHAMVHGGPFPATSDGRSTSVGTLAIQRFLRPVCYQDLPQDLLPPMLRDAELERWPHLRDGAPRLPA